MKDDWKLKIFKLFFTIMSTTPGTSIGFTTDQSAYEIGFKTTRAKFHIRIYDTHILVFSNRKDDSCKRFEDYTDELKDFIKEIIQDSEDKF